MCEKEREEESSDNNYMARQKCRARGAQTCARVWWWGAGGGWRECVGERQREGSRSPRETEKIGGQSPRETEKMKSERARDLGCDGENASTHEY